MSESTALFSSFVTLSDGEFEKLAGFIETRFGIKMPKTKKKLLESRLQKRLRHYGMHSFGAYMDLLFSSAESYSEISSFIDEVTTNKTDFFREKPHFDYLADLLKDGTVRTRSGPLRLWSVAASSGEEPYSLAMICEERRRLSPGFSYEVIGTDISYQILKKAVRGIYPQEQADPIPEAFRRRYLLKGKGSQDGLVRVAPSLRSRVTLYRMNLMDGKYGLKAEFDIVFCRNVLIYFDADNQRNIMRRIYSLLNPGGYLFMGPTEGMLAAFLPLEKKSNNIFRKPEAVHAG